jgi:hypothetical protein
VKTFKRCILGAASVVMVAAGIGLFPSDALALKCYRTAIPPGFTPDGGACSQTCESQRYSNDSGTTICVILGPKAPTSRR